MANDIKYYVVKQKALPEVLLKVAQVNRLVETKGISIADATESVGISRSSYYKYKDDIFPFRDNVKGKTITFVLSLLKASTNSALFLLDTDPSII